MTPIQNALRDALLQARRDHRPLAAEAHWELAVPDTEAALALQQAQGEALGAWAPGALPRHWKSGSAGRDVPLLHAPLLPGGVWGDGADLSATPFFAPLVEAELALRLGRDVSAAEAAALGPADADALPDAVALSIEVVDSRWLDLAHTPALLKLADFQVHGALVLGDWLPWSDWRAHDWSRQAGRLQVGDAPARAFVGSHPLGTPQWLLPHWLRHLTRHGATVPAGTIVTTGAWCGAVPVSRGLPVQLEFEHLGRLGCRW